MAIAQCELGKHHFTSDMPTAMLLICLWVRLLGMLQEAVGRTIFPSSSTVGGFSTTTI